MPASTDSQANIRSNTFFTDPRLNLYENPLRRNRGGIFRDFQTQRVVT
jgi:hypothetical protein